MLYDLIIMQREWVQACIRRWVGREGATHCDGAYL